MKTIHQALHIIVTKQKQLNLTMKDLAAGVPELTYASYRRYLDMETKMPLVTFLAICDFLDIKLDTNTLIESKVFTGVSDENCKKIVKCTINELKDEGVL